MTITVGLLIALGLENAAEAWQHRHLRHEAEVNIRAELLANRDMLLQDAATVQSERKDLIHVIGTLELMASAKTPGPQQKLTLSFGETPIPDAAWTTAKSNGALAYMPYDEVESYADAYKQQAMLETAEESALNDYLEFTPILEMHQSDLTPAEADAALPSVRRALAHVSGMLALGQGTLGSYKDALK
jgi:hypothetical protein